MLPLLRVLGEPDGVLSRNFAVHGGLTINSGRELWWKESANSYKVHVAAFPCHDWCTSAQNGMLPYG